MKLFLLGRRSSGVEQLIRNQQAAGSNPIAGSIKINRLLFLFPFIALPFTPNCEVIVMELLSTKIAWFL
jgi:hypothetical protein